MVKLVSMTGNAPWNMGYYVISLELNGNYCRAFVQLDMSEVFAVKRP